MCPGPVWMLRDIRAPIELHSQAPQARALWGLEWTWPRSLLYVEDLALKLQLPHLNRKPFPGAIGAAESEYRELSWVSWRGISTFPQLFAAYYLSSVYLSFH